MANFHSDKLLIIITTAGTATKSTITESHNNLLWYDEMTCGPKHTQ